MRKNLALTMIILVLLFRITAGIAFAANTADAVIPVIIEGGGTAYIIPEVNCPLPTENPIQVDNGRTGHFHIEFTEPGEFHYSITMGHPEVRTKKSESEVFHLTVAVFVNDDGSLYTVSVINNNESSEKEDEVRFKKDDEETTTAPDTPTYPDIPTFPDSTTKPDSTTESETTTKSETTTAPEVTTTPGMTTKPDSTTKPETPGTTGTPETTTSNDGQRTFGFLRTFGTPKTGDESHLTRYVLVAMGSSAGLFLLALLYTINTNKLIKKHI